MRQPTGCRHDYAMSGNVFMPFLAQVQLCLIVIAGKITSKMAMVFLFRSFDLTLAKQCLTAKQLNCVFLVLKKKIQNVAAAFAFFTVVTTRRFKV